MKNIYYKIMISSVYTAQNNGFMSDVWKFTSSFYFAVATTFYLLFGYLLLNNFVLVGSLDFLVLKFISQSEYNVVLNMVFYIIAPVMAINYWLIVHDSKYKKLIKKYQKYYTKKIFAWYFMLSIAFMFGSLFLKVN